MLSVSERLDFIFTEGISAIITKLDLYDIAFLCNASPPKALIVQY